MTSTKYDGIDRRTPAGWAFKKEITLGDMLAGATAVLAAVMAYTNLDKRVAVLEQAMIVQLNTDRRQDEEGARAQARLDDRLTRIEAKLDRIIEARK